MELFLIRLILEQPYSFISHVNALIITRLCFLSCII